MLVLVLDRGAKLQNNEQLLAYESLPLLQPDRATAWPSRGTGGILEHEDEHEHEHEVEHAYSVRYIT